MPIPGNMLSATTESIDPNTSGWTAKLNATLSKGVGGRNGDGCLAVTSVAAGEAQARTVASYAVVAGTVYQVFGDASGASVPEKIGIRWLDWKNVELSITWSVVTTAASTSWHRIGVAAAAPATARKAQVVVSSTPAGAGVVQYYENFYLGLPIRTPGNLLPFGTESFEIDTTGWGVVANCTLSRQAPAIQWSVDNYLGGGAVMALTVTAGGNASALCVDRPAVTPGAECIAYAYLNPPTSGSTCWVELRFYDAGGTQVSATRSTLAAPGTGYYRQRAAAYAPATAATCAVAVGIDGATAAQVMRVETVVAGLVASLQAGTVVPYADASFEQGVAGWTKTAGVAVIARSTPWGGAAVEGSYSLAVTSATATASTLRSAKFPLPAGSGGLDWRLFLGEQVTAGSWTMARGVRWYDAANVDLGLTSLAATAVPTPGWWYLSNDHVAPANATQAAVELTLTAGAVSSAINLDRMSLWQALPLIEVDANDTSSFITLTLRELTLDRLLTVYRVGPDGARTLVRGPHGLYDQTLITTDYLAIEDYEAPLGTPVYYLCEILTAGFTTPGTRTSNTITLAAGSEDECWLKDPGRPYRNMKLLVSTPPSWERSSNRTLHRIAGRALPVSRHDVRGGLEGDLVVMTRSDDERAALHTLLDSGSILLLQCTPGLGVADMYVDVDNVPENRIQGPASETWRTWTLPLTQVDMPTTVGVGGSAGNTWQDVLTVYGTWQALADSGLTWEQVLRGGE